MKKQEKELIIDCLQIRINFLNLHIKKSNHKIVCLEFDNKDNEMSFYDTNTIDTWNYGIENAKKKITEIETAIKNLNT